MDRPYRRLDARALRPAGAATALGALAMAAVAWAQAPLAGRRAVPALASMFTDAGAALVPEEPSDLPAPFPLLAGTLLSRPEERTLTMGRVYTRAIRLARHARRLAHEGRRPDLAALPPLVTSPAILVAWDYVPEAPPPNVVCGFARGAPARVSIQVAVDGAPVTPAAIQPLLVTFDRARIRELLEPYETDVARVRFLAVLDPGRLRAGSFLYWETTTTCPDVPAGVGPSSTAALIAAEDIARWLADRAAPPR